MKKSDFITLGPRSEKKVFIFAHGAGAPMDSDWMNEVSMKLKSRGIKTVRFEFPYMQERRENGKKRPPNTQKVLLETWREVISLYDDHDIYIGGKSMGGRMASLICDEVKPKGLICLGFPFHAPGKSDPKDRIDHLKELNTKTLILQGERDTMGSKEEVLAYQLSKKIKLHWLPDGDHSLKPRVKSGYTLEQNLETTCDAIARFMK